MPGMSAGSEAKVPPGTGRGTQGLDQLGYRVSISASLDPRTELHPPVWWCGTEVGELSSLLSPVSSRARR